MVNQEPIRTAFGNCIFTLSVKLTWYSVTSRAYHFRNGPPSAMTTLEEVWTQLASANETVQFAFTQHCQDPGALVNFHEVKLQQPKQKHVRREKLELEKLRYQARRLQTELAQLQIIYKQGRPRRRKGEGFSHKRAETVTSESTRSFRLIAPRKKIRGLCGNR